MTVKAARAWVREHHRHLPNVSGGLFAVAIVDGSGNRLGVAIAGRGPRVWEGTGRIVITRVAAPPNRPAITDSEGEEHACPAVAMLYSRLCRAAKALGYREAWTYTLPHEPGVTLRAAGFEDMGLTKDEDWNRPSRSRATAVSGPKRRWRRKLA